MSKYDKYDRDNDTDKTSNDYHMKGIGRLACCALSGFLVWCTFNYDMSDTMRFWFFVWAVLCSL